MAMDPDTALLGEALGLPGNRFELRSCEPLGRGSVSGYAVTEAGDGASDPLPDGSAQLYYLDTSGLPVDRETGLVLGDTRRPEARIWQHPADPHLTALPVAAFPDALNTLLARAGLTAAGPPEMVAYRPGRRAVLRVVCVEGVAWMKVVRGSRLPRILEAHRACVEARLPLPGLRFWAPDGLLVWDQAIGTPAIMALSGLQDLSEFLDEVDALRQKIGAVRTERPVRGIVGRLDWYAERVPGHRADELVSRIRSCLAVVPEPARMVSLHGDLHLDQLFLDQGGRISGLIDVDTLGRGDPAEDPAAFLGHAIVGGLLAGTPGDDRRLVLADVAIERWGADSRVLPMTAIHLLGHALGGSAQGDRIQAARVLTAAESLLDGVLPTEIPDRLQDENLLMKNFDAP